MYILDKHAKKNSISLNVIIVSSSHAEEYLLRAFEQFTLHP